MPRYICIDNRGMEYYLTQNKIYEGEVTELHGESALIINKADDFLPLGALLIRFELVEEIGENLDD